MTSEKRQERVEKLVRLISRGTPQWDRETFDRHVKRGTVQNITWDEYLDLYTEAAKVVEEMEEAERKAEEVQRVQALRAKLHELIENDTSIEVKPKWLDRLEAKLLALCPQAELDAYNLELTKKKSKAITYRDIAFVAVIHRLSVTENGGTREDYRGTSPFSRITKASTALGYRETPFDNRQVRHALSILEVFGFTGSKGPAIHGYKQKGRGRAGTWWVSTEKFWEEVFETEEQDPEEHDPEEHDPDDD